MDPLVHSDSVVVAAPAAVLYAMVSDVTRMGEWSPVCKSCSWEADARGVGAWFTGRNETPERTWETRSEVVAADPGREFAFVVGGDRVRWGYRFVARTPHETEVIESWEVLPGGRAHFAARFGDDADAQLAQRAEAARTGIAATLAALKAAAEDR